MASAIFCVSCDCLLVLWRLATLFDVSGFSNTNYHRSTPLQSPHSQDLREKLLLLDTSNQFEITYVTLTTRIDGLRKRCA